MCIPLCPSPHCPSLRPSSHHLLLRLSKGLLTGCPASIPSAQEDSAFGRLNNRLKTSLYPRHSPALYDHVLLVDSQEQPFLAPQTPPSHYLPCSWFCRTSPHTPSPVRAFAHAVSPSRMFSPFSLFLFFLLEYSFFTMLCQSLLYSKVNQLYVYIYPFFFSCLPIQVGSFPGGLDGKASA